MQKRIAIFDYDITVLGGVEVVTTCLSKWLSSSYYVDVVSVKNKNKDTFSNEDNLNIIYLGMSQDEKRLNKKQIKKIEDLMKEKKYDKVILQLNGPTSCPLANVKLCKILAAHSKLYAFIHGSPKSFISRYNFLDGAFLFFLKKLYTKIRWEPCAKSFFFKANKYVTNFFTLSNGCKKELQDCYHLNSLVRYNPYDFCTEKIDMTQKENICVWAGRLSFEKNIFFLLDAWSFAKEKDNWTLQIIGSGPQKDLILRYITKNKIKNVQLLPAMSHAQLMQHLKKTKILCFTSFHEGFPTIVTEAMNQKNALITTRYDGFSDELLTKDTCIVTDFSPKDFAFAIQSLITNKKRLETMQNNAYLQCRNFCDLVQKQYDRDKVIEQISI